MTKTIVRKKEISTSKLNESQRTLHYIAENMKMNNAISVEGYKHFQMAIKALDDGVDDILDKIRAEIEQLASRYTISRERGSMGQVEWADRLIREDDILRIINKYKAESEE